MIETLKKKLSHITLPLAGIVEESVVDGTGLRTTIFVQGCPHQCKGCHNPSAWEFSGGQKFTLAELFDKVQSNPLLSGITLSGGEPFCYAKELAVLSQAVRELGLNVWCYTGYTLAELQEKAQSDLSTKKLLDQIDVLVDGPFIESQKSGLLKFRGSNNQRIIDLNSMRTQNTQAVILLFPGQ